MTSTERYAVVVQDHDHETIGTFHAKLREVVRIVRLAKLDKVELSETDGPVKYHVTTYLAEAHWRSKVRPLAIKASVSPGTSRPVVRLNVEDLQAKHTTTFFSLLRLDQANAIAPGCPTEQLLEFIEDLYQATRKTLKPYDPNYDEGASPFDGIFKPLHADISHLINAFPAPPLVSRDRLYAFTFAKPFALPSLAHCQYKDDDTLDLTPILGAEAAAILSEGLPELVTVARKETRNLLGFAVNAYTHTGFGIAPAANVIEQMKALGRFADIAPEAIFNPGVYTPAIAA